MFTIHFEQHQFSPAQTVGPVSWFKLERDALIVPGNLVVARHKRNVWATRARGTPCLASERPAG